MWASPPQGDPDPGTPAPKWPGPRDPSAKLARTPDPGPRPGPRTTRRFWAFGVLTTSARGYQGCAFVCFFMVDSTLEKYPPKTLQKKSLRVETEVTISGQIVPNSAPA